MNEIPVYLSVLAEQFTSEYLWLLLHDTDCHLCVSDATALLSASRADVIMEVTGPVAGQALIVERWEREDVTLTQADIRVHPRDYEEFIAQYRDPLFVR